VAYQVTFWDALLPVLLGWALLEGITHIPYLRVKRLDDWLWKLSTGTRGRVGIKELADRFARRLAERQEGRDELDR